MNVKVFLSSRNFFKNTVLVIICVLDDSLPKIGFQKNFWKVKKFSQVAASRFDFRTSNASLCSRESQCCSRITADESEFVLHLITIEDTKRIKLFLGKWSSFLTLSLVILRTELSSSRIFALQHQHRFQWWL